MAPPESRPTEKGDADWLRAYNLKYLGKQHPRILDFTKHDGVLIARTVPEELCHEDSPRQLRAELEKALADGDVRRMILDVSSLHYAASTFVGTLFWLRQALGARAGTVHLSGVHWRLHELFELCQLYRLIPSHPHLQEALTAVQDGG